jgi:tetratricopeptide (TPR) repeat protein
VGVFLFGTVRDVMLWLLPSDGKAPAFLMGGGRPELEAIIAPPQLVRELDLLSRLFEGGIGNNEIGGACIRVARWASARSAPNTELAFTQAAALAEPDHVEYAFETGKLARELSQHRRAESWLKYTIKSARRIGDRRTYVLSYVALGNLYRRIGNGPAAKAMMEFGLGRAQAWRLGEEAGRAHHDLIRVLAEHGDVRGAYHHAKEAERHYGAAPMLTLRLAADVAALWLRVGACTRAQSVFGAILPAAPDGGLRAAWSAELARCLALRLLGAVNDPVERSILSNEYEHARERAELAISDSQDTWRSADALWSLALADLGLGLWDRSAATAAEAVRLANLIGAAEIQVGAERTIEHARAQHSDREALYLLEPVFEPPSMTRLADRLAGAFQESVAA